MRKIKALLYHLLLVSVLFLLLSRSFPHYHYYHSHDHDHNGVHHYHHEHLSHHDHDHHHIGFIFVTGMLDGSNQCTQDGEHHHSNCDSEHDHNEYCKPLSLFLHAIQKESSLKNKINQAKNLQACDIYLQDEYTPEKKEIFPSSYYDRAESVAHCLISLNRALRAPPIC